MTTYLVEISDDALKVLKSIEVASWTDAIAAAERLIGDKKRIVEERLVGFGPGNERCVIQLTDGTWLTIRPKDPIAVLPTPPVFWPNNPELKPTVEKYFAAGDLTVEEVKRLCAYVSAWTMHFMVGPPDAKDSAIKILADASTVREFNKALDMIENWGVDPF